MPAKFSWKAIAVSCLLVFSWSVYRDMRLEKQYAGDLRNRVVGARMQKDGLSPYFYKWKNGDGFRYYDPNNFDSLRVSNITASPFFHHLLRPIADLPQHSISIVWLVAEYVMLIIAVLLAIGLSVNSQQRWLVVITACLLLLTEAWKMHIGNGQNYICVVLLAMLFYYCIHKRTRRMALAAGLAATCVVLIKPTAVLPFIPFLFWANTFGRKRLLIFLLPAIVAVIWTFSSSNEKYLWTQYRENIQQQILVHQHESPGIQMNDRDPAFPLWEGIDQTLIRQANSQSPVKVYSENGNFFVVVQQVLHRKINKTSLSALAAISIILLLLLFYRTHRASGFTLPAMAIAGFCLFMITDLLSPVYRHQYYTVQWMFPIMVSAAVYQSSLRKTYLFIMFGVLLNIINIAYIPMEHTIGEYIMLVGFIVLSLRLKTHRIG